MRVVEVVRDVNYVWPCRVYYEDTDGQGFLYHNRCMNFFERARTEWVRSLGVTQSEWLTKGLGFVVSKAELHYHRPAFLDDALLATVNVLKVGATRITLAQQLLKLDAPDSATALTALWRDMLEHSESRPSDLAGDLSCIVSGEFSIAFIDLKKGKPVRMPEEMAKAL